MSGVSLRLCSFSINYERISLSLLTQREAVTIILGLLDLE